MPVWEFERDGEVVKVDPTGPLIVRAGAATDLAVDAAVAGTGVGHLFEDWLRPVLERGALEPVLQPWWRPFTGPFLYCPSRRYCRRRCAPSSTERCRGEGARAERSTRSGSEVQACRVATTARPPRTRARVPP